MLRTKWRLEEGWISFLLLVLMLLCVVWSVRAAEWTDGLGVLQWVALAAMGLTLLLARRRRFPAVLAHLVLLVCGAACITLLLVMTFNPPLVPAALVTPAPSLLAKVRIMYLQMVRWLLDPGAAELWLSNFMFVTLLSVLTWVLSSLSAWFVLRSHWVWGAVVPAGVACLLNIYYAPPRLTVYFVSYCLFALLLVVRMHIYLRQSTWRQASVNFNIDVDFTFLRDGLIVSVLALFLAWSFPVAARSPRLAEFWGNFQDPWNEVQDRWNRLFASLRYQGQSTLVQFGPAMTLGGAVNLSNVPVLEVEAAKPGYWRAVSYDRYTGSGWLNTDDLHITLQPEDPRLVPVLYAAQRELTQTIRMLQAGEDILFFAGQLVRSSVFASARVGVVPLADGQQGGDVSMLQALRTLRRNQSYTNVSLVSDATAGHLRAAGTDYPQWVRMRYLQLPRTLPTRVRTLAREIVAGAETPYEQAVAIQEYLRRITYDQYINAPPAGRDVVDWFLFDNRRGYCDYYATAMAMMCRAVGIPARISQGYTPGEYLSNSGTYLVRQLDAHAWPELFFPGYGWIEFEPTASEPLLSRPQDDLASLTSLPGNATPLPLNQEEDKFGPDEVPVDADVQALGLASQVRWYSNPLNVLLFGVGVLCLVVLLVLAWWYWGLRGLSTAASVYERMRRLGGLLGVAHRAHQTPVEYGEALANVLASGGEQIRYVAAQYVKQCFSRDGLSQAEEHNLNQQWRELRFVMWRKALRPRLRWRRRRTTHWVPASALRPAGSM